MLAMLHPTLTVFPSVYLLPLRHPVPVARQLVTLAALAPGRLVFGVGIGGEDPHEVEICGVDPRTRGRRMDEALEILRGLLAGRPVTFRGQFFAVEEALILPTPPEPIPIVVGGRSDAALRRTGRFADGWIGIWNSPRRFAEAVETIEREAEMAGRREVRWRHGMQVWCAVGPNREQARARLAAAMESTYKLPFERFERYSPYGRPADIAGFLASYVEVGCTSFNLGIVAASDGEAAEAAGEVKRLLIS
jgi:alkanesulfonate monooxygenase SsuD/methylene tetrahydromethanopterin reductase-like flavin-dependent oxidoreductase (luciferase family)